MSTTNIANAAFDAFFSGQYPEAAQLLEQLSSNKGTYDVKIAHNLLINQYYQHGCNDAQWLLTQLSQLSERVSQKPGREKGKKRKDEEADEDQYREDEDVSILRYNQALLCVQLRHYTQATYLLEDLFQNVEPIDDFLAIKICFLLLELYLMQREPEQAAAVLAYLEKPNAFLTVLRSEQRTQNPGKLELSAVDNEEGKEDDGTDNAAEEEAKLAEAVVAGHKEEARPKEAAAEGPLPSLALGAFLPWHGRAPDTISLAEYRFFCLMYRARVAVTMQNGKAAKKDVKQALDVLDQELKHAPLLSAHPHTTASGVGKQGGSLDAVLRDALHFQRNSMCYTLKAYLEYSRQNVRKAMKLLTLCQFNFAGSLPSEKGGAEVASRKKEKHRGDDDEDGFAPIDFHPAQDDACAPLFFNNLGCLHFLMHKPGLATFYFQKALQSSQAALPGANGEPGAKGAGSDSKSTLLSGRVGLTLPGVSATKHWLDRRAEISYNAGLQLLLSGRPLGAFRCFEKSVGVFKSWPRLWLRIAECCLEMHREQCQQIPEEKPNGGRPQRKRNETNSAGVGNREGAWNPQPPGDGWPLPTAAGRRAAQNSAASAAGLGRSLLWGTEGSGPRRRWLVSTSREPPIGGNISPTDDGVTPPTPTYTDAGMVGDDSSGLGERLAKSPEQALGHATMCLRNILALVEPYLPERGGALAPPGTDAAGAQNAQSGAALAATGAAADKGAAAAATPTAKGAAKTTQIPSAPERTEVHDRLECESALLEDAALTKLAYCGLCQKDYASAVRYARRLLLKNCLLPAQAEPKVAASGQEDPEEAKRQYTFQATNLPYDKGPTPVKYPSSLATITLGVLYLAEALLHTNRTAEASHLLGGFVASVGGKKQVLERQSRIFGALEKASSRAIHVRRSDASESSSRGTDSTADETGTVLGGVTSPAHIAHGVHTAAMAQALKDVAGKNPGASNESAKDKKDNLKDGGHAALVVYPQCELASQNDAQAMLYSNLASLHIHNGNLAEAERCCDLALKTQPSALGPLRTMVYLLLKKNEHAKALQLLKKSRVTGMGGA